MKEQQKKSLNALKKWMDEKTTEKVFETESGKSRGYVKT